MSQVQMIQQGNNMGWSTPAKWGACLLLAVLVIGGLMLGWSGNGDTPQVIAAPTLADKSVSAGAVPANEATVSVPLSKSVVTTQQKKAASAVAHQVGVKAVEGTITRRPDFVSEIEWQVLQGVASKSADSGRELTRLVNNLRFSKQLDLWRSLARSADVDQRHALATQLLADIPARVVNRELDYAEAQKLQQDLLADLVSDPVLRSQRAAQEARRLTDMYTGAGASAPGN